MTFINQHENRREAEKFGIFWHMDTHNPRTGKWGVTCGCGAVLDKAWAPARPYDQMLKQFRVSGWTMERGRTPVCPACSHPKSKEAPMKKPVSPAAVPVETAAPMSIGPAPKIARKVFALLDDHFNESKRLYAPEWSDERIAGEVDCHVDVVVRLRREAYGELAEDPEVSRMRADIDAVRALVTEQVEAMGKMLGELDRKFDQWAAGRKIAGR